MMLLATLCREVCSLVGPRAPPGDPRHPAPCYPAGDETRARRVSGGAGRSSRIPCLPGEAAGTKGGRALWWEGVGWRIEDPTLVRRAADSRSLDGRGTTGRPFEGLLWLEGDIGFMRITSAVGYRPS